MISLIGALIGFAGSAVPSILDIFKQKAKNKLDLDTLRLQGELMKQGVEMDIQKYHITRADEEHKRLLEHDQSMSAETGFFGGLRKSVRPIITYMFFALFAAVKISMLMVALDSGQNFNVAIETIWDEETQAIFASIVAFWFGSRSLEKRSTRRSR